MTELQSTPPNRDFPDAMALLRHRAERRQRLIQPPANRQAPPLPAPEQLIEELEVHRIELELQHEELQLAQMEAEALRARYADLFDFAPLSYLTIDVMGLIQEANLRAAQLLGVPRHKLAGQRFLKFVAPSHHPCFLRYLIDVLATDQRLSCELELVGEGPRLHPVRLEGLTVPDAFGNRQCRLLVVE